MQVLQGLRASNRGSGVWAYCGSMYVSVEMLKTSSWTSSRYWSSHKSGQDAGVTRGSANWLLGILGGLDQLLERLWDLGVGYW